MSGYTLSPIFEPQYVANPVAALALATTGNPVAVPTGLSLQLAVLRVANITPNPVNLTMWRVPAGVSGQDNQHIVIPQIAIPPASATLPALDLSVLWGIVLQAGDALFALASAAQALVIHGDGVLITP